MMAPQTPTDLPVASVTPAALRPWTPRLRWAVLGLSLAAVALLRLHSFAEPLEGDEATYLLMARLWEDGGRPYLDLWDNKPIGTFIVYRLGLALFGYAEHTPRLLSLGAMLLSTGLVTAMWWRRRLGVLVLVLLVLWPAFTVLVRCHANGANMEVFLLPFILGSVACLQRYLPDRRPGWWWAAAALLAVSLLIKPVTLPFLLPLFAVTPWRQPRAWPRLLLWGAGLAAGITALHLLVYGVCGYGPGFVGRQTLVILGHPAHTLATPGAGTAFPVWPLIRSIVVLPADPALLPVGSLLGAGIVALIMGAGLGNATARLWLWVAAATILAIVLPGSNSAHYYVLALPVLLAGAVALFALSQRAWWRWGVGLSLAAFLGWWTYADYLSRTPNEISHAKYRTWFVVDRAVGQWLLANGHTGQRLFVDGSHATIYFYSGNRPAGRFHCAYALGLGATTPEGFMATLRERPPDLLVLLNPVPVLPGFAEWQAANYEPAGTVGDTPVRIYRRRH